MKCDLWATDVEIFPNLFSITFVDIKDYLNKFKDCGTDALSEHLTVKEIKERLNQVRHKRFYISDTDDSQLLEMVSFINNMQARYDLVTKPDGTSEQVGFRTDVYGYNIKGYDDYMIKAFLMRFNQFDKTKYLITYLYEFSKKIIRLQNDKDAFYNDKELEYVRTYKLPYVTVDVQRIFGLHASTVNIDKDTGERIKYGKSLKQTSINLKWYELLDFKLPPIDKEEADIYWHNIPEYRGMPCEQLNILITNDFDRYILPKYIEPMLHYNLNDVFIVCEMIRQKPDEIRLRYSLSNAFKINLLCCSRANIADRLLVKFYSERSGLKPKQFEKLRTERKGLAFNKIIFPHISFKTKQLQDLLTEMKQITIYHTNKDSFVREIDFYGTKYTLATGGIHTVDKPGIYKSDNKYTYIHWD